MFLIPCGRFYPSGVRRVLGYLPLLKRDGFDAVVRSYFSERALRWLEFHPNPWLLRVVGLGERYRRVLRAWSWRHAEKTMRQFVRDASQFDVVFIQWVFPAVEWTDALILRNSNVVYDFDDAVFLHDREAAPHLIRSARLISTGSHFCAEYARTIAREVVFLPTPVTLAPVVQRSNRGRSYTGSFTIGWLGNPSTVAYLKLLVEPLRELVKLHPGKLRLLIVGSAASSDQVPRIEGLVTEVLPWVEEKKFAKVIPRFDVGVMPLPDGDEERGKCGLKALWYMAFGVPVVSSPVGEANYIIQDGVNGLLARDVDGWVESIEKLIVSPRLSRNLAREGLRTILGRYTTEICYNVLRDKVLLRVLK